MTIEEQRETYRQQFARELADLLGTTVEALPSSVSKADAATFLGLKNPRTLNVWASSGRHGIAMLKVGRDTRPMTAWLLDMKAGAVRIAEAAA